MEKQVFQVAFESEFQELKEQIEKETNPNAEQNSTGGKTPGKEQEGGSSSSNAGKTAGDAEPDADETLVSLGEKASDRAADIMHQFFSPVCPSSWCSAMLAGTVQAQSLEGAFGRFVALFDPKCDEDARVHDHQNYFLRFPPLNKERLEEWAKGIDTIMTEGQDIVVILEGKVAENREKIKKVISAMKWKTREMSLHYDEDQVDQFCKAGNVKKRRRCFRGFATATYSEIAYICWKGQVPRIGSKKRRFVNPGSRVASDCITKVPIVSQDDLPLVEANVKDTVLKGSTWSGKPEQAEEEKEELFVSSSGSEDADEKPTKRKGTKRGRALLRRTSSTLVPFFSHPTSKELAKEFFSSFGATWVVLGTPEAGCSVLACLELKVPVIAMCRNAAHAEAVQDLTKAELKRLVLSPKTPFTSVALATKWAEMGGASSDSSSDDDEAGGGDNAKSAKQEKKTKTGEKKTKKDKDKKKPKEKKEEKSQETHKDKENEKKGKKDKQEGSGKEKQEASSSAVLNLLMQKHGKDNEKSKK